MKFSQSFPAGADCLNLSPIIAEQMKIARQHWRDQGLSVQYYREDGTLTEWSFNSAEQRDRWIAKNIAGKEYAISKAVGEKK